MDFVHFYALAKHAYEIKQFNMFFEFFQFLMYLYQILQTHVLM